MVENYKSLTQQELSDLQEKIVKEHWFPTSTHFSLHIYEERYSIDDIEYRLYYAIGSNEVTGERLE